MMNRQVHIYKFAQSITCYYSAPKCFGHYCDLHQGVL